MKKEISRIAAVMLAVSMLSAYPVAYAEADPMTYVPSLYFGSADEAFTVNSDGELNFDRGLLEDGDYTLKLAVYIEDETFKVWDIRAKWICKDEHIKLTELTNPKKELIPYAYASADENGEIIKNDNEIIVNTNERLNSMAFACVYSSGNDSTPLKPYGEASDSYPLTYFEAVIDKDTPVGTYKIEFRREPNSDYPDIVNVNLRTEEGPRVVYLDDDHVQDLRINIQEKVVVEPVTTTTTTEPTTTTTTSTTTTTTAEPTTTTTTSTTTTTTAEPTTTTTTSTTTTAATSKSTTTTTVTTTSIPDTTLPEDEIYTLGDVDENGMIDAADATLTLQTYSELSTGRPVSINARQQKAADTNKDGMIDSSDATSILRYYSFMSTGGSSSFEAFLKSVK